MLITDRLCERELKRPSPSNVAAFQALLAPAQLIAAAEILSEPDLIPAAPGIYGWWFDAPIPEVALEGTLSHGLHHLLYIGIAPRKPSSAGIASKSTLRRRIIRNHLGRRIGSSTLRRSLAYLLRGDLGFSIERIGKKDVMSREQEFGLSQWIKEHAGISYLPHNTAWEIEDRLLGDLALAFPLNIKGSLRLSGNALRKLRALKR